MSDDVIRAAGCVLWRQGRGMEIALVHRPRYDDWSHPKGKLKRGEKASDCAVREVLEETGMACELGAALPTVCYEVGGRCKEVRYWGARAVSGVFVPNREVDALLWLPVGEARVRLTQERDRWLVDALLSA
ncbi:NUDIX hydrolase [Streptomyces sp. NPDC001407]|uniref:NUDIX hydrolase n=1 Tax=unclassified Streptomyces TaxID=2593676 RepID=UPI00340D9AA9